MWKSLLAQQVKVCKCKLCYSMNLKYGWVWKFWFLPISSIHPEQSRHLLTNWLFFILWLVCVNFLGINLIVSWVLMWKNWVYFIPFSRSFNHNFCEGVFVVILSNWIIFIVCRSTIKNSLSLYQSLDIYLFQLKTGSLFCHLVQNILFLYITSVYWISEISVLSSTNYILFTRTFIKRC